MPAIICDRFATSTTSIFTGILWATESFSYVRQELLKKFTSASPDHTPIVDLFAGPGGLGEGFSSVDSDPFRIIVSAEMNSAAHKTLRLRAFYRLLKRRGGDSLTSYYRYVNGESTVEYDSTNQDLWHESGEEARQLVLGDEADNVELDRRISEYNIDKNTPWVLIGGPPCQAYSLVGRARNRGKSEYKAEEDHRHFLYKEYLRIIGKYRPAVFVMENVKGILTASVGGKKIFETILEDLAGHGYTIHSAVSGTSFKSGDNPRKIDVHDFVIRAELHGIPQARHRVILIGVRDDIKAVPSCIATADPIFVGNTIGDLPKLRSTLSKQPDSSEAWAEVVSGHFAEMAKETARIPKFLKLLHPVLKESSKDIAKGLGSGNVRLPRQHSDPAPFATLIEWYADDQLKVWLNHQARGHMTSDLRRYAFASAFAKAYLRSPKGHADFSLDQLRPDHENWESGKFADRFKVQVHHRWATTVTSHISKDGHYFIHPDPLQCRSLTVREAARLQTFKDNYFFEGNRTEQFHQVGNAVPPLLAKKIGEMVHALLEEHRVLVKADKTMLKAA